MNIVRVFDWFARDSAYAAEHTDEPRQRDIWIKLAELWKAAALAAEIADHTVIPVAALAGCKGPGGRANDFGGGVQRARGRMSSDV